MTKIYPIELSETAASLLSELTATGLYSPYDSHTAELLICAALEERKRQFIIGRHSWQVNARASRAESETDA